MIDLEKLLIGFPNVDVLEFYVKDRNPYESNQSYLDRHKTQALWLLKNSDLILRALSSYYEGERPNE